MENEKKMISLAELGVLPSIEKKEITIGAAQVEVITKLPYEQVIAMIEWAMSYIIADRSFVSAPLNEIFTNLALVKFYTNIDISCIETTSITVDEVYEIYDLLDANNGFKLIVDVIDATQYEFFKTTLAKTMESIVQYKNSAAGIIENLAASAGTNGETIKNALDLINDDAKLTKTKEFLEKAATVQEFE